jgi:hypothetical protein
MEATGILVFVNSIFILFVFTFHASMNMHLLILIMAMAAGALTYTLHKRVLAIKKELHLNNVV